VKTILIVIFGAVLIVVGMGMLRTYMLSPQPQKQARPTDTASINASTRVATLAQQKMCAEQADKAFNGSAASEKGKNTSYVNHYDARANVCYVIVHEVMGNGSQGYSYFIRDAFEGRIYGSLIVIGYNPNPAECDVTPHGQETIRCKSSDEFDALVAKYFGMSTEM
jgi:hypothetical protein